MNTRMFKNGFQSAMILVVVAILGLAGGSLIRDLMQASSGDSGRGSGKNVAVKEQSDDSAVGNQPVDQAQLNSQSQSSEVQLGTEVSAAPEIPQFDILRVEKNGGVLVAGRTLPNNEIEVLRSTGEVLGKVTAKRNGDFVVTLDEQLTRGEHILNLASTDQDGTKVASLQTGVVFIPGTSGEVLALINQDGKASRVATMPVSLKSKTGQAPTLETNTEENISTAKLAPPRPVTTIEKHPLLVEAVEVEGKNVFVAGAVAPAALVRIYIDNVPVGSVRGTADHRFLLEKKFNLSQGEHVVRADVINEKTGGVWSRVVVDLTHEVSEELLNVAGKDDGDLKATEVSSQANSTKIDSVTSQVDSTKQAATETPKVDETVAQVDKVKQPVVIETTTTVVKTAKVDTTQSSSISIKNEDAPKVSNTGVNATDTKLAAQAVPKNTATTESKATETAMPKDTEIAMSETTETKLPKKIDAAIPEKVEPAVPTKEETAATETITVTKIQTGQSIIVKWGDSLWRISRRTYGRGIRYTTIYNANSSQISDPNKIYVGQVFKVPAKADL